MFPNRLKTPEHGKPFDVVVFDLDSTLVAIEGLDWLAAHKHREQDVVSLTKKSMDGQMDFREAMRRKMAILSPSEEDMKRLGEAYGDHIVPGAREVIEALHAQGKEVWIVTGNFEPAVGMIAAKLGIPAQRVVCNHLYFDSQKHYAGFDQDNPLAGNGGKALVLKHTLGRDKRIVFVGDGMTDLEVKDHVSLFVGFGGVAEREMVKRKADCYISSFSLIPLLSIIKQYESPKNAGAVFHAPSPFSFMDMAWMRVGRSR